MKSIALKLWSGMMILILVVLLLLWFFQIVFLGSFYTEQKISKIKNQGISLADNIGKINKTELQSSIEKLAYDNNASIELLDTSGSALYSTGMEMQMPMMFGNMIGQDLNTVLKGQVTTTSFAHPRFGTQIMLIGIPVKVSGQIQGALFINMPMAPVKDTVAILKSQLVFITLILLIAALILSYFLSRSFTRPILTITKAAGEMASGNLSVRITSESRDEIGRLAETINYLGEELSKIDQLRKDLIANISHELRTPLSIIRGYAETIRDVSGGSPEKREKQLEIIIDETERLGKLVEDILHLSQIQSGNLNLNVASFNLGNTLESVVKRYEIVSKQTGIKIALKNTSEIFVTADETRIEQVLYNLINNAFNHADEAGLITINSIVNEGHIRIEVADTGSGISGEDIKHIWDRYYRADKANGKKRIGTGLGLAIVKSILDSHRVPFGVESQLGHGTTFWFELKKTN